MESMDLTFRPLFVPFKDQSEHFTRRNGVWDLHSLHIYALVFASRSLS